ncbi:MAG: 3'(2'),5'-bisphosphate nucleotidase CysQ, partial [Alphaproteobacteria bacterium]|nr:3'(2'),5'-bisphosphate nucleotidase CysQ [Alphaproteobacteria bacterium]
MGLILVNGVMMNKPHLFPTERDRLARLFAEIASDAGVAVMEVYATDFEARTKADSSPVSDADERAEEIILKRLAEALPGVGVLAEEECARDGIGEAREGTFLLVDPVDGTKEFLKRNGQFTVNIALVEAGRPIVGCVFAPARKDMYFGGAGARLISGFEAGAAVGADDGRILRTREYPADGLIAVTSSSHLDEQTKAFLAVRKIAGSTAIGSSLKFCLVAAGEADIYP